MDERKQQDYESAIRVLKHSYIRRLYNTVRIIDNILVLEKIVPFSRNDLLRAQSLVHGLAGSGTTFGFPEITQSGQQADYFLEQFLKKNSNSAELSHAQHAEFLRLLLSVQKVCQDVYNRSLREMTDMAGGATHEAPGLQGHAHILIVEDDAEVSSVISMVLKTAGMTIQKVGSGADALHYLARVHPDLVLLDMNLTDMNGMEVLQQIKQNSEFLDIPVIILATRYNEGDESFSLQAGAAAYIRKPVDIDTLVGHVNEIIGGTAIRAQSI